jgi:hypothetical protein
MEKAFFRFTNFLENISPAAWCINMDHNLLRITRIIRSLRFFGMDFYAKMFTTYVIKTAHDRGVSWITIDYWNRALNEPLFNTLY